MSIWNRFLSYLRLSNAKLLTWGVLLVPYVAVMIFYSGVLPKQLQLWIHRMIYSSSLSLSTVLPTPIPKVGVRQVLGTDIDAEVLTIVYFLVTYLWSCILVESFDTIRGLHKGRVPIPRSREKHRRK